MNLRRHTYRLLSDQALLARLVAEGPAVDAAWKEFLRRYSNLFLKIIWQFETDHDEVMDKYLYVCSKLAANDLAIVRRFKQAYGDDPPKFSSWLYQIALNLCRDRLKSKSRKARSMDRDKLVALDGGTTRFGALRRWCGRSRHCAANHK